MKDEYSKIQTIFKRDPTTKHKTLLMGEYSLPVFEYLKDNLWLFTEKVDGTNIRVRWCGKGCDPVLGGKTDRAQIPAMLVGVLNSLFTREGFESAFDEDCDIVTLYGEGYGARIQKGGGNYIPDGVGFILFDVRVGNVWLERDNVADIARKFKIRMVPVVSAGTLDDAVAITREGFTSLVAKKEDTRAEGLVLRPRVELHDRMGHRVITKIKYKDFPHD